MLLKYHSCLGDRQHPRRGTLNSYVLKNMRIYSEKEIFENGFLKYNNSGIIDFGSMDALQENPGECIEISLPKGSTVIPGMIDVHVHGASGADAMDASEDALQTISSSLAKEGTTSFLATTMTQDFGLLKKVLSNIASYAKKQNDQAAAEIIGVHLEGPFINLDRAGAQPTEYILAPDIKSFTELQESAKNMIKIVTIAPEVDGAKDLIKHLSANDVIASLGHSCATGKEAEESFLAGSKQITHFFNGLNPLHHREAGVIGAALNDNEQYVEMIVDGKHVEPNAVKLVFNVKGAERILLITDSMRAKYLPDGEYELGGQPVFVQDGEAKLGSGTLAGSVLKMDAAVRNMMNFTNCTLSDIVKMTSENQAKHLGVFDRKGSITVGKDADLVILDENQNLRMTICRGEIAYEQACSK